jgi:hypothetical protein
MSKFESKVKPIAYPQGSVYKMLSDLKNLERVKERMPEDKLNDLSFDSETITINANMIGRISMRVVEREEPKMIKFESTESPVSFTLWIQVVPVGNDASKMRLTIDADIPFVARAMVSGPLQDGLEKIADLLAAISYEE